MCSLFTVIIQEAMGIATENFLVYNQWYYFHFCSTSCTHLYSYMKSKQRNLKISKHKMTQQTTEEGPWVTGKTEAMKRMLFSSLTFS